MEDRSTIFASIALTCEARRLSEESDVRLQEFEVGGRSAKLPNVEETIAFEIYDDFHNVLVSTVAWRNTGSTDLVLQKATIQKQRLNASETDPSVPAYRIWSFQGSSGVWGKDEITQLS
jgi:hypothetical protein